MAGAWARLALCLALLLFGPSPRGVAGMRQDCCLSKWTGLGGGCSLEGTVFGNDTYYCVTVADSCSTCATATNTSSSSCYQCCAPEPSSCGLPFSYISTSSWSKSNHRTANPASHRPLYNTSRDPMSPTLSSPGPRPRPTNHHLLHPPSQPSSALSLPARAAAARSSF